MNSIKNIFFSSLLTFAAIAPGLAKADYSAIARAGNGAGAVFTAKTQNEANWEALKACNEDNPQKDCKLTFTKGVVEIRNKQEPHYVTYVRADDTLSAATTQGLQECGKPSCYVSEVYANPGFWVLAKSKNEGDVHHFYITRGFANFNEARADAVKHCQEMSEYQCAVQWTGVVEGEQTPAPNAATKKK